MTVGSETTWDGTSSGSLVMIHPPPITMEPSMTEAVASRLDPIIPAS